MEKLKELPIGIQNFESLRRDNYLYVDKTALVYKLATTGKYYFLSRPRRFGKSMLISTLHAYFDGKKELFDGLAISELEKDWVKYPVLHIDLNTGEYKTADALRKKLTLMLSEWENAYGRNELEEDLGDRFAGVIKRAAEKTGRNVVILVDEYDKPLLQTITDKELNDDYRGTLKSFYGVLKSMDEYIRFALLTGVTKFSKVSVFSDLNNLKEISMRQDYDAICGITDEEIDTVFAPYVQRMAEAQGVTMEDVREKLRTYYDGYHFAENTIAIYNPFSLLNALDSKQFKNYWFETGTPTFLVDTLRNKNYLLRDVNNVEVSAEILNSIDDFEKNPLGLLFQSGYITIKGYTPDETGGLYTVGYPNREVEVSFIRYLLPYYANASKPESEFFIQNFVKDVRAGNAESFLYRLQSFFADTSYNLTGKECERTYQNVIYIISKLMGFYVQAEYCTSYGRIDMVLQTDNFTYVMEFKFDGTAEEALQQINDKSYTMPFEVGNRKVIKIGLNFSKQTRNIERWVVE